MVACTRELAMHSSCATQCAAPGRMHCTRRGCAASGPSANIPSAAAAAPLGAHCGAGVGVRDGVTARSVATPIRAPWSSHQIRNPRQLSGDGVAAHAGRALRNGAKAQGPAQRPVSGKSKVRLRTGTLTAAGAVDATPKLSEVFTWKEDKRIQTQVLSVAEGTTTIRSLDWDRDRFDIEFGLQEGTTYNSYIIRGADKVALIDASHEKFRQLYLDTLKGEVDPSTIDYVIVSHTEPDHSGLVGAVLDLCPDATVVGSKVCLQFLANLVHKPFNQLLVKNEDTLDLGGGHQLTFIMAPNLHWPDTIFTYDAATNHLFTCDAFGMHYCTEEAFDPAEDKVLGHYAFYYECLMKPNARSVVTAMRKCKDLTVDTIATGHGPILRDLKEPFMAKYQVWSEEAMAKSPESAVVFFTSGYGFSERLAQALELGIAKTGVEVDLVDLSTADTQDVIEAVASNNGVVVLSPPAGTDMEARVGTVITAMGPKKSVLVCESYGGSDEPVDMLSKSFAEQGAVLPMAPLKVTEDPSESTFKTYEESGTDLGQALITKKKLSDVKGAMPAEMAKALGKLSGGLYVVTAAQGTARSGMIASWVSQASFEPLGFTIAVAKDRAIESLMQVGDAFVLNCLPEEGYQPVMKHFLKRFAPGADRFEGVKWKAAECGAPILAEGVAHMECKVVARMEANDHWVVYSEVLGGKVTSDERTATHTRKVGTYY